MDRSTLNAQKTFAKRYFNNNCESDVTQPTIGCFVTCEIGGVVYGGTVNDIVRQKGYSVKFKCKGTGMTVTHNQNDVTVWKIIRR